MRTVHFLTFALALLLCLPVGMAQSPGIPAAITDALGRGDASGLAAFFDDEVALVAGDRDGTFTRLEARGILSDFFRRNRADSFNTLHKGEKEAVSFLIGTLRAGNGTFRVYLLTRTENNKNVIQQLRIEPTNE